MTDKCSEAAKAVVRETRALFQALRALADAAHAGPGINASMRAVMETLAQNGPQTVPAIAQAKTVSRQHIQTIADEAIRRGFVEVRPNPQHKRSSLIALTRNGKAAAEAMAEREVALFEELGAGSKASELEELARNLSKLRTRALVMLARLQPSPDEDEENHRSNGKPGNAHVDDGL